VPTDSKGAESRSVVRLRSLGFRFRVKGVGAPGVSAIDDFRYVDMQVGRLLGAH